MLYIIIYSTLLCILVDSALFLLDYYESTLRYFIIHAIVNFIVLTNTYKDLTSSFDITEFKKIDNRADLTYVNIIIGLHVYHTLLQSHKFLLSDWLHHIFSCFITGFIGNLVNHKIVNVVAFFMCGLPGFVDYVLLTLTKLNRIESLFEKEINSYLNSYIRMPGLIWCIFLLYNININLHDLNSTSYNLMMFDTLTVFIAITMYINAVYYTRLVCVNYGIHTALDR